MSEKADDEESATIHEERVEICNYGEGESEPKITDPLDWPSGHLLAHILRSKTGRSNFALDCENELNHSEENLDEEAKYWQASARRALLEKYGYLPCAKDAITPTRPTLSSIDVTTIRDCWVRAITDGQSPSASIPEKAARCDLLEFISSKCSRSNGRQLQWSFMQCPAGLRFPLHAHPNIELIYCCAGALHEIRMEGTPITKDFVSHPNTSARNKALNPHVVGPTLNPRLMRPWRFGTLSAGHWLVNEVGSIHQSFTATNSSTPCRLLVLWSGAHANIVETSDSLRFVDDAVSVMDQRLGDDTCCSSSQDWTAISETFLPDSEKKNKNTV